MSTLYLSNTDNQVIDTFDIGAVKTVHYSIRIEDFYTNAATEVEVTHDGVNTTEQQTAMAVNYTRPAEITTVIANNVGYVKTAPLNAPAKYHIERTDTLPDRYGEHVLAGMHIAGEEGLGIYFPQIVVRQESNNSVDALTANTIGPVDGSDDLLSGISFESYNYSELTTDDDIAIASSGQQRNCQFLKVPVVAGEQYTLSFNAFFTATDLFIKYEHDHQQGHPEITVGDDVATTEYAHLTSSDTDSNHVVSFTPTTNFVYLSFGFGELGTTLRLSNLTLKKTVPFTTYLQNEGTMYLYWVSAGSNAELLSLVSGINNNVILVDGGIIKINGVSGPSQVASNILALKYSNTEISYCFNGSAPVQIPSGFYNGVSSVQFGTQLAEFAYTPTQIDDSDLMRLSNG